MIAFVAISVLFYALSAACKGVMDTLQFHFETSRFKKKNPAFWNPKISWRNKYKNGDPAQGPRFPLSATVLVFLTDGWHLFSTLAMASQRTALVVLAAAFYVFSDTPRINFLTWSSVWIGLSILHSAAFHLMYTIILPDHENARRHRPEVD